jgi:hypothetical protein
MSPVGIGICSSLDVWVAANPRFCKPKHRDSPTWPRGKLAATGLQLNWQSQQGDKAERKAKLASKTKYTCPACGVNAWAKPDTNLICGDCYEPGEEPLVMEAV